MSPYRTAPASTAQKAHPATWWRRLTHRGVSYRLEVRRRRHLLRARFRSFSWREAHSTAEATVKGHWSAAWQQIEDESWECT